MSGPMAPPPGNEPPPPGPGQPHDPMGWWKNLNRQSKTGWIMLALAVVAIGIIVAVSGGVTTSSAKTGRDYLCRDIKDFVLAEQSGGDVSNFQGSFASDSTILRGEGNNAEADAAAEFARSVGSGGLPDLGLLPTGYCVGAQP